MGKVLLSAYFASLSPLALLRAIPGSIAQGLIWGLLALGVYITYKLLDFADLSVDGSFATGGAVAVMLIRGNMNPWLSLLFAFAAGMIAVPCDKVTLGMMIEELYHSSGCNHILYQNSLTAFDIVEFGTPEQIQKYMDAYMETGWPLCSLSISEPGAGSDNRNMSCTAKKQDDGTYRLNGQKTWVTMGAKLPYTIVVAKDEDPSRENDKMSLWMIEMDRQGVSTAGLHKIGQQCIPFCEVYFDDVVLTEEDRVGTPGEGFMMVMKNFEVERALLVAEQLGLAQAAMEDAVTYANQRIAFNKPIANFQMTQEKLTEMEIRLQNTRNMLYKTLWELDNDISVQLDSALLKRYGCTECFNVADMALSIFGGIGYTTEVRVGRIWADCRGNLFGGGTPEIMAYIAGRQVAKKYRA